MARRRTAITTSTLAGAIVLIGCAAANAVVPTGRAQEPSPSCERRLATYHDGSKPTRRLTTFPPAPGLRARALTPRRIRVEWWFESLPANCRPVNILLSITTTGSTPTNFPAKVSSIRGSAVIVYPAFLPLPETALASSYMKDGRRSRVSKVAITR